MHSSSMASRRGRAGRQQRSKPRGFPACVTSTSTRWPCCRRHRCVSQRASTRSAASLHGSSSIIPVRAPMPILASSIARSAFLKPVHCSPLRRQRSFFGPNASHVVLRAKERACLRPHGQILRTGSRLVPDEASLTTTVWMDGVFHSMVTQGHVNINRFLSTTHSYLGLFRSHGL